MPPQHPLASTPGAHEDVAPDPTVEADGEKGSGRGSTVPEQAQAPLAAAWSFVTRW